MIVETEKLTGDLPLYDRSEEWHSTLVDLQTQLAERRARRGDSGVPPPRTEEDEVEEATIRLSLRKLGVIVSSLDARRHLNYYAETLLSESEEKRDLVITALERSLPLLLDAPQQYVSHIIAAAAVSFSDEKLFNAEADIDDSTPPVPESSRDIALHASQSAEILDPSHSHPLYITASSSVPTLPASSGLPDVDGEWTGTVRQLQRNLQKAEKSKGKAKSSAAREVINAMLKLASLHPDPKVKDEITDQAKRLQNADEQERENMFKDLAKGVGILFAIPLALGGALVFATGSLFYGTGKIIVGIGQVLTLGKLQKKQNPNR